MREKKTVVTLCMANEVEHKSCLCFLHQIESLQSQLSQVQGENNQLIEGIFATKAFADLIAERDSLLQLLAKERDEFGKKETALMKEVQRLRGALNNIVLLLGPTIPDCCEGAEAEIGGALEIAKQALASQGESK